MLPEVRGRYRLNANLAKMSWFGVGGTADILFIPADLDDLSAFLSKIDKALPIFVFGVGSNILIRDGGIRGIVIRLGAGFNYIRHEAELVTAGAATLDTNVATYCLEYGIGGLEFLSGIPGTIGGALCMNAGAYGSDIASTLHSAKCIDLNGEVKIFNVRDIKYQYRANGLNKQWIFVEGRFKGMQCDPSIVQEKIATIQNNRGSTQPIRSRTGGSTFKNPEGFSAWKLIDQAGCRGLRIGGAQVSEQHCNFFINTGNATAADLEDLISAVQQKVFNCTGIFLESEIKVVGEVIC